MLSSADYLFVTLNSGQSHSECELARCTEHVPPRLGSITDTDANDNHELTRSGLVLLNHIIRKAVDSPLILQVTGLERADLGKLPLLEPHIVHQSMRLCYTKE